MQYRLRIDDAGDTNTFYCGDYQIYLSHGSASRDVLVYDHLGGRTDGGYDDDTDDDSDIYLNWRSNSSFNGEDPSDYFYLWVDDSWSGDEGILNYIQFDVYWETSDPNLIADYTPSGWDYPIVPSSVSGTRTVGPNLQAGATTYIDFAFINRDADIPTSTRLYTYLYDGSNYLHGWYWDGIQQNHYGVVSDYQHTFSAGNHTLKTVADATDVVAESNEGDNEYSRTFYWASGTLPNLIADYVPSGWDYPIIASSVSETHSIGPDLRAGETTYIDFAFINRDADIPSSTRFYVYLYDGSDYLQGWYVDGLQQNYYITVSDFEYVFSAGNHTLNTFVDATGVVSESNENDNEYAITFTWQGQGPNLVANYTPSGWDSPIVASSVSGTNTIGPDLKAGETTYIDFAFVNRDADIPTGTNFWAYLYDGSTYLNGWYWDGIQQDYYGYVTDSEFIFTEGHHTLRTEVDATGVVAESNESDNEYSHEFIWESLPTGDPDIDVQPTTLTINQTSKNSLAHLANHQTDPGELKPIPPIDSKYIVQTTIAKNGKEVVKIIVPGKPPENYRAPVAQMSLASITLPNMPAYDWSFGCSATAAAMMAGHYDNMGYPDMYTGPTNGGMMPMDNSSWGTVVISGETRSQCPLSATRDGVDGRTIRGHVDDYWIKYGEPGPDPFVANGWSEHTLGECTGDYMGTNQDYWGNTDGSTTFWNNTDGSPLYDFTECETYSPPSKDGCHGLRQFFESRGYDVIQNYSQYIYGYNGNTLGFTYEQFKHEIDVGRPVMIHVEGHSMVGFGYEDNSNTIYIHDTWDYQNHTMNWGESYSGMQHYAVSVVELEPTTGAGDYFTIYNVGSGVLTVHGINNSKNWLGTTAYPTPPFDVQPGSNQSVVLNIDWNLLGAPDQDIVEIHSNDPDEPTVTVTVTANPVGTPELSINPESYHAPVTGGNQVVTVTNSGAGGTFTWTASSDRDWISVAPTTGNPGESFTITVPANPGAARSGTVTVSAPGANGSPKYVQVTQDGSGDQVTMWMDTDLGGPQGGAILIPIHCSDLTGKSVYSSDITITYDQSVLEAVDTDISGTLLDAAGWGVPTKNIMPGEIVLAMAGSSPLSGSGILVKMLFNIVGPTGATSPLHFETAFCNEGEPPVLATDGFFTVMETNFDISGRIGYYSDVAKPVGNVNVVGTGAENKTAVSMASGEYELLDLGTGNYTVTPGKSGEVNNSITAYDASIILRYSVGSYNLTPYGKIAADVSGNGSITAYDASFILRYSVGVVTGFPVGSDWTFVPHDFPIDDSNWSTAPRNRTYTPLDSDQPGQDYVGILYGDVSGNWPGARLSGTGALVELGIDQVKKQSNGNILIPLEVNFSDEAYSGSFKLKLNNSNFKFVSGSFRNSNEEEAFCVGNAIPQGAAIALASAHPLHQKGLMIDLVFKETNSVDISSLEFDFSDIIVDDRNTSLTVVRDESKHEIPKEWELGQNHPNPFNAGTVIDYQVPQTSHVSIEVYNLLGQRLRILVDQAMEPGSHHVNWNGMDDNGRIVGSGIYLYKMRAGRFMSMKKMVLVQ